MAKENVRGRYSIIAKRAVSRSVVECPDCSNKYIVYRGIHKSRAYQAGHIKDLWCYKCKAVKKHVQLPADEAKYNY